MRRFLEESIDTVPQLETLQMMHETDRGWEWRQLTSTTFLSTCTFSSTQSTSTSDLTTRRSGICLI